MTDRAVPGGSAFVSATANFEDGNRRTRHAKRYHAGLAELASEFGRTFNGPVDIHLYCTPAGQPGFGWHCDVEEVFDLQTLGAKQCRLRKNSVNPGPPVRHAGRPAIRARDHAAARM